MSVLNRPAVLAAAVVLAASGCAAPRAYVMPELSVAEDVVKVGSFNILQRYGDGRKTDWEKRRETVVELIRFEDPDILGLQEVMEEGYEILLPSVQLADLKAAFPDYEFIGGGNPNETPANNPIMVRADRFEAIDTGWFFFSRAPEVVYSVNWAAGQPVYARWALLDDLVTGRTLYVVNVHYDHLSGPSKRNSSRIVSRYLRYELPGAETSKSAGPGGAAPDIPVIVLGDFNSFRVSFAMARLRRAGLRDALSFAWTGSYHMLTGVTLFPRIDHIMVSDTVDVLDGYICYFRSESSFPSDHFPVFAFVDYH